MRDSAFFEVKVTNSAAIVSRKEISGKARGENDEMSVRMSRDRTAEFFARVRQSVPPAARSLHNFNLQIAMKALHSGALPYEQSCRIIISEIEREEATARNAQARLHWEHVRQDFIARQRVPIRDKVAVERTSATLDRADRLVVVQQRLEVVSGLFVKIARLVDHQSHLIQRIDDNVDQARLRTYAAWHHWNLMPRTTLGRLRWCMAFVIIANTFLIYLAAVY